VFKHEASTALRPAASSSQRMAEHRDESSQGPSNGVMGTEVDSLLDLFEAARNKRSISGPSIGHS
jgi:hypothetical protein